MTIIRCKLRTLALAVLPLPMFSAASFAQQRVAPTPTQGFLHAPPQVYTPPAPRPSIDPYEAKLRAKALLPIDINSASAEELMVLPGLSFSRALAIQDGRPYRSPAELVEREILPRDVYAAIAGRLVAR
jgi:hypothetical protein